MADNDVNDEIYRILGRGKPSEEDAQKNPKLKADWDRAQQLIKDNWKDGVPDEFMAKAFPKYESALVLGGYGPERAKRLANIVAGLKEFDENNPDAKMLDKFINADNTPNGNTPATYIAHHAVAMNRKLEEGKFSDKDREKLEPILKAQQETLQMLADNGADFSKTDNNHQSVEEVAQIGQPKGKYSPAIEKFIAKVLSDADANQAAIVTEEKMKSLNVKEGETQGQTNIGTKQQQAPVAPKELTPQQEQVGDVKPEDNENTSGSEKYKGPDIREKDIIDYLYNDVFIHYLNMLADKIIGYIKGKADKFAEYTRRESSKAKQSKSDLRNSQCDLAREKCIGLFQNTAPQLTAEMEQAQLERSKDLRMLHSELRENIVNRRPIEQWAFPSLQQQQQQMQQQAGADANDPEQQAAQARLIANTTAYRSIVDSFKQVYMRDPEASEQKLEAAEKNLDKFLDIYKMAHTWATQEAAIEMVNEGLEKSNFKWINDKDWNMNDPESRQKLGKRAENKAYQIMTVEIPTVLEMANKHGQALGYDEAQQAMLNKEYIENYFKIKEEKMRQTFDHVLDDVAHDRFKGAAPIVEEKARGMDNKEAKEYKAKFARVSKKDIQEMGDIQDSLNKLAKKMKVTTTDGQEMSLMQMSEQVQRIDFAQRSILDDLNTTQDIIAAAQGQLHQRQTVIHQGKKELFGLPDKTKSAFESTYTPKRREGGR